MKPLSKLSSILRISLRCHLYLWYSHSKRAITFRRVLPFYWKKKTFKMTVPNRLSLNKQLYRHQIVQNSMAFIITTSLWKRGSSRKPTSPRPHILFQTSICFQTPSLAYQFRHYTQPNHLPMEGFHTHLTSWMFTVKIKCWKILDRRNRPH